MRIGIYVREAHEQFRGVHLAGNLRMASWHGESPWSTIPTVGAGWVHCSAWSVENFAYVNYVGPAVIDQGAGDDFVEACDVTLELFTSADVMQHLVERHGFTGY